MKRILSILGILLSIVIGITLLLLVMFYFSKAFLIILLGLVIILILYMLWVTASDIYDGNF